MPERDSRRMGEEERGGVLKRIMRLEGEMMDISKIILMFGSSKVGRKVRAKFGSNWVITKGWPFS